MVLSRSSATNSEGEREGAGTGEVEGGGEGVRAGDAEGPEGIGMADELVSMRS